MRLLVFSLVLAGCRGTPPASPPAPAALDACSLPGAWTLTARASCIGTLKHAMRVHAGPPDASDGRSPMFDVAGPIVASGRTDDGYGYDRLLRITDAHATGDICEMHLHVEYVGPHEAIEYTARATLANGRLHGTGTYRYDADDCQASDPAECMCESALTIEGEVS